MITKGMFSSNSDEWSTPQYVFDKYNLIYHFDLDVCATAENAKCCDFFTKADNGLDRSWSGHRVWCNPPYSDIKSWCAKAYRESLVPNTLVTMLLPSRTDTAWFHDYIFPYCDIDFIRGRLHFNESYRSAPFGSLFVVFDSNLPFSMEVVL